MRRYERTALRLAGDPPAQEEARLRAAVADGPTKVGVVWFCDTRESLRRAWELNVPVVKHNMATIETRGTRSLELAHHVVLHESAHLPAVETLLEGLRDGRALEVLRIRADVSRYQAGTKLNAVAAIAFDRLAASLRRYHHVLILCQDFLLVNHHKQNLVEIMLEIAEGRPGPISGSLMWGPAAHPYVAHTTGADPTQERWRRHFRHNAAVGGGLFPIWKLPYVERSVRRAGDWIPAEFYLSEVLGQRCTYLRPDPRFYIGQHGMRLASEEDQRAILALTDPAEGAWLSHLAGRDWGGTLKDFTRRAPEGRLRASAGQEPPSGPAPRAE